MERTQLWETNYKQVMVKISDGSVYSGRVNICDYPRFSDFLRNTNQFITMISDPGEPQRTTLLNKNAIIFAEPRD
jgi:hypothetical protein